MSGLPFTGFIVPSGGSSSGGSGDVTGPGSSTDNAIARFDGTGGKTLQDSGILVTDAAQLSWEGATADDFETTLGVTDPTADRTILLPNESGTLVVGSTGSTDAAILIADGTGGSTLKATAATLTVAGTLTIPSGQELKLPLENSAATPTINFGDGDTGFFELADDTLAIATGGSARVYINSSGMSLFQDLAMNGLAIKNHDVPVEANTAGSGAPNVLAATESSLTLTNEGATAQNYHTLPTAASGQFFTFCVQDADGMRIVAAADDTIRVLDKVTTTAGYIESTTIGSTVRLVSINAVEWFATSIHGVWTDGTFTFDDTGSTSP